MCDFLNYCERINFCAASGKANRFINSVLPRSRLLFITIPTMNKKQYRDKNKKRNRIDREVFADPSAGARVQMSSAPLNEIIAEHKQPVLEIFELIATGTEEELSDISAREKLAAGNTQSKLQSFVVKLLGIIGHKPPPAPDLTHLVRNAYNYADGLVADLGTSELACRKGCFWCCSEKVALSIPEVFYIANYLDDSLPPAELTRMKEKIRRAARQVAGMSETKRRKAQIFCPLLVDGKCSVYVVRPLTCRGYNSLDESVCEKLYLNQQIATFPYSFTMKEFVYTVFYGISEGANQADLQPNAVELITALDFVFNNPDAESRWLRGETVFPPEMIALESYQPVKGQRFGNPVKR